MSIKDIELIELELSEPVDADAHLRRLFLETFEPQKDNVQFLRRVEKITGFAPSWIRKTVDSGATTNNSAVLALPILLTASYIIKKEDADELKAIHRGY